MADVEVLVTEGPDAVVTVEEEPDTTVAVTLTPPVDAIEVSVPGPAGPQGPPGELIAGTGDLFYAHTQSLASSTWTVTHNLDKYPSVTVVDSAGTVVIGDVDYIDANSLTLFFSAPFSGVAYLN